VKRIFAVLVSVLLVSTIIFGGCGEPAEPTTPIEPTEPTEPTEPVKTIEWTFASFIPGIDIFAYPVTDWAEELEEKTDGRLKVNFYWAASLVKAPGLADAIEFGTADLGHLYTAPHSERYPLSMGLQMYGIPYVNPAHMGEGFIFGYDWIAENYPESFDSYWGPSKLLWVNAPGPRSLIESNREIRTLDDVEGLKMSAERFEEQMAWDILGAQGIPTSSSEWYMSLNTGVIDAIHLEYNQSFLWKTHEVTKYRTENTIRRGTSFPTMYNEDAYNKLPEDLKTIFDASYDVVDMTVELNGRWQAWHDINKERIEAFHEERGDPPAYILPDEESDLWNEMVLPVVEDWIQRTEAKGLPGRELWDAWQQHADETKEESVAHLAEVLPRYIEEERPRIE
jgi:TRAP-type C4-dicarboxylate transport system substrate-binding protein